MSKVNYHILKNSIVVNYDGETTTINKNDGRYEAVKNCIKEGRVDDIPEEIKVETFFNRVGMELKDGQIYMDGEPLPETLSKKVLLFRDEGLPTEPLFEFWENLRQNPSLNSREMLYRFLEHNGHPLTEDGCFIAYRGVTDDFRDCRTRSIDNSVGSVVEMPREQVDDNPNNTCSYGLHVACFNYAEGFGPKLIEVKVNPKDVVCVPEDYEGTKMRVCRYEVVNESDNRPKNDTLYGNEVNTACVDLDDVDEDFLHEDEEWSPFFRDDDDDLDEDELY